MADHAKSVSRQILMRMEKYRQQLLAAGMQEPTKRSFSEERMFFWKPATQWTAFIVNATGTERGIKIIYGYASTAFTRMAGDEMALVQWGVSDEDITIREAAFVDNEDDESNARTQIARMYERFRLTEKDELLKEAKAKRNAFIHQIAVKLKPMGFRKKANSWTKSLEDEYYLMFNAQKSAFSDEYYFNIYIGKTGTDAYGDCWHTRVFPGETSLVDWQTIGGNEFELFLNQTVVPVLDQIIRTPLRELGRLPSVWSCCPCSRQKCERCWVEKNL